MKLNRDLSQFPSKRNLNFLSYCSVSPLSRAAATSAQEFIQRQLEVGRRVIFEYSGDRHVGHRFHAALGRLMKTSPDNISMVTSTSEGLSMIANGYPFEPGDEIISYINEYPANHYPWVIQSNRQSGQAPKLVLLADTEFEQEPRGYTGKIPTGFSRGWSFEELESKISDRTRLIALSHVQFTNGFAADLKKLGELCGSRNIDLVVDAAQSLGCLPVYPEEFGISCVAASGWKWLMGPIGSSVLYTSPAFREKIQITMTGADQMRQDTEYLDHTWNPVSTGKKFEYSTVSYPLFEGLAAGVEEIFLTNSMEAIWEHNLSMQELALEHLDMVKYQPVVHRSEHRSGILSLIPKFSDAKQIAAELERHDIVITPRDGYLRFAPHLVTTEDEVLNAVEALNRA